MDIVYVLTHEATGNVEMATTDDAEAWFMYNDMQCMHLHVFINKNKVNLIRSINSSK